MCGNGVEKLFCIKNIFLSVNISLLKNVWKNVKFLALEVIKKQNWMQKIKLLNICPAKNHANKFLSSKCNIKCVRKAFSQFEKFILKTKGILQY